MSLNKNQEIECFLSTNQKGQGFCKFLDKNIADKVEIKNDDLNRAFSGDLVKVKIIGKMYDTYQGKVTEIVERKQHVYAGHIEEEAGKFFFKSHDKKIYTDFYIPRDQINGAKVDDKVIVEIYEWQDPRRSPLGRVLSILGKRGDSKAEIASMSEERGFGVGFPDGVEEEAVEIHKKGITEKDIEGRRDFRKVTTFTIDPIDAKDFDDAISVEFLDDDIIEVGVHIADVSHYLKPGMKMNDEAERRTTSVYLVDRVVPMLPEVLSNDLCSLVPNQDRLTMSAVFKLNKNAEVIESWFGETVIYSDKRFTYEGAQEVILGNSDEYKKEIIYLNETAKILKQRRYEAGSISLETEEVKFKLDENGVPVEVIRKVRFDAHKLVEEFMLLANVEVAKYIADLGKKGGAEKHVGIYRVHDKPDAEKMHNLSIFLYNLGYNAPFKDDTISPHDLNKVMEASDTDPNQQTIQTQIVRSMQKAVYSTHNIGHYGLAFKYYSHFTSPIRRLPDVLIHRLMKKYLKGGVTDKKDEVWHEAMCLRSSQKEKDAADAERGSVKYKQVEYMSYRIGQEFTALVTGLAPHGIYLEEEYSKCEGMVRFRDLGNEFFTFDEKKYIVQGDQGTIFKMGDVYKVKVVGADLELKTIDYQILEKVRGIEKKRN
jgi:ribonuclease R